MANQKASINFGLVNIPVDIINAEDLKESVHFHMLDSKDNSRIRFKRVNENSGKEVPWNDIIKGYQVEEGKYVTFSEKELGDLQTEANQGLQIESFVNKDEISPYLFEKPYYLAPRSGGEKGYLLLQKTLAKKQKYAVVQAVLRNKEHLAVIYPEKNILVMDILRYSNEVKKIDEVIPQSLTNIKISEKEIAVAERLISEMEGKFEPHKYKDHYAARLKDAIKKMAKGGKLKSSNEPAKKDLATNVVDIMDLLNKSLGKKNQKASKKKKAA